MSNTVYCITKDYMVAESIVAELRMANYSNNSISILFSDKDTMNDFVYENNTKAPEGATVGSSLGMGLGAALGWLVGIGTIAVPGVGAFVAAGPIMAALSGAAVGAASGGITGAIIGLGIPEYEAKRYEGKINGGAALISVKTENDKQVDFVKSIYKKYHAEDIAVTDLETVD